MSQEPLVEAYRAANGPQAHLVAHFLQGAGIPAFVDGDELTGGVGVIPAGWSTAPRVLVPAREADHARALIAAAESADDGPLVEGND